MTKIPSSLSDGSLSSSMMGGQGTGSGDSQPAPPRARKIRLDRDGVPVDAKDWDVEDWQLLWEGIQAIRKAIARRHREKHRGQD